MKHDNVTKYDAFMWNWFKSALCDDALFIASCLNNSLVNEIHWPIVEERVSLGTHLQSFSVVLGSLTAL